MSFILEWQKKRPFQMVSHMHYNLNANNEDFVIYLTSKFITCFIDIHLHALDLTSGLKFQRVAYLLREREYKYWILGPSRWSALNMGFVDNRLSRIQGRFVFRNRVGWLIAVSGDQFFFLAR